MCVTCVKCSVMCVCMCVSCDKIIRPYYTVCTLHVCVCVRVCVLWSGVCMDERMACVCVCV